MMQFYPGNKTGGIPGLFGDPYYWWEAGAVFGVSFHPYSIYPFPHNPTFHTPPPPLLPMMMVMMMMWE